MAENNIRIDSLVPAEMAQKAEDVGVKKASLDFWTMFALAILAGAFISLGAVFATTVGTGGGDLPFGVNKLLMGLVFTVGLIMVIVGGAELFTGNNLIVMAFMSGKVSLGKLLRNWAIVYFGNLVGSVLTAYFMFLTKQYTFAKGALGLTILNIGESKTALEFVPALALGVMCNALVCMAVWLTFSARTTTDKILAIIPPISAFVAAGMEHSVANMYFIPIALFVKYFGDPSFFEAIGKTAADFPHLTVNNFFIANLLPVTIGNIIGGVVLVGVVYWFIYLRKKN
ncbi:formate transporter [Ornatilinea apprima]|uniref:Formate transporter n=1 Tax=Ornatilinea apprima TaxID=1134406 RepID=A0A0P6WZI1_9CHLR|nr:formate transporter FocA [Ornatilinea apprima]KPL72214.1 formate transporter [Ornatilinea apprima]